MKASPGNMPSSLSQRCHSLLVPDASSFKFLIWGRGGFHNSLITYFLVLTWTAYGLFLVCGCDSILRILYPLRQAGKQSTMESSMWSCLVPCWDTQITQRLCPWLALGCWSVNQWTRSAFYLKLGCFPKIPVQESATPSSAGNKSMWGSVCVCTQLLSHI